jgi:hypothetical protein
MEGNKMRKLIPCAMSFMLMFAAPVMAQTVDGNQIGQHAGAVYFGPLASFTGPAPANFGLEAG